MPYWTFDAKVNARYTALGGRHRTVTRKGADGKTEHRIVTDWYPTSGNLRHFFDDILVPASEKIDARLLRRTGYYGTQQIVSYAPEYLSGYGAECYTVDLNVAHREIDLKNPKTNRSWKAWPAVKCSPDMTRRRTSASGRTIRRKPTSMCFFPCIPRPIHIKESNTAC